MDFSAVFNIIGVIVPICMASFVVGMITLMGLLFIMDSPKMSDVAITSIMWTGIAMVALGLSGLLTSAGVSDSTLRSHVAESIRVQHAAEMDHFHLVPKNDGKTYTATLLKDGKEIKSLIHLDDEAVTVTDIFGKDIP